MAVLAMVVCVVLTGCGSGSEEDLRAHFDTIAAMPLWQRVVAIATATLISEDMACIAAGLLASEGAMPFFWAMLAGFLGIYIGDVGLYVIGRIGGIGLLRRAPFRWVLKEEQVLQAEELFLQHGAKLIFSSRLLPGSRLPIYAAAGVLGYPFWKFALFMAIAGGLSAVLLVWVSYRVGDVVFEWLRVYEAYALPFAVALLVIAYLAVKLFEILATRRSRLRFLARIRRTWQTLRGIRRRGQTVD